MAKTTPSKTARVARIMNLVAGAVGVGVGIVAVRAFASAYSAPLPVGGTGATPRRTTTTPPRTPAQTSSLPACPDWMHMTSEEATRMGCHL